VRGDSDPPGKGQSTKVMACIHHAWLGQGGTGVEGEGLCCSWGPCVSPWPGCVPSKGLAAGQFQLSRRVSELNPLSGSARFHVLVQLKAQRGRG